jgi:hypothetical protein
MAENQLVDADIKAGQDFIQLLDANGFDVKAAAWIYYPDIEGWKLLIGSPRATKDLSAAYYDAAVLISADKGLDEQLDLARVKIVKPDEAFLDALGKVVRVEGLSTVRFTHNTFNGVYIDDALVYRLAA